MPQQPTGGTQPPRPPKKGGRTTPATSPKNPRTGTPAGGAKKARPAAGAAKAPPQRATSSTGAKAATAGATTAAAAGVKAATAAPPRAGQRDRGRPPAPGPRGARATAASLPAWLGLAVAVGALLLPIATGLEFASSAFVPELLVLFMLGAAGLPVLVVRLIGRGARGPTETWAARFAGAFVVVALLSTVLSAKPLMAFFGQDYRGTGWFFLAALAGSWAVGTALSGDQRQRVELFIIIGAVVNAVVAALQQFIGLGALGLPLDGTQPDGVLGNPVFLGALMAAALVLVAPRFFASPRTWWWAPVTLSFGLGLASERFPVLLALVVLGLFVIGAARHRRTAEVAPPFGAWWQPSVAFAVLSVISVVAGSLLGKAAGGVGVLTNTANSTRSETYGQRVDAWRAAAHAIAAKPLLGWGPGRFLAATTSRYPTKVGAALGANAFPDAHNIFVELATTTGLLGLVCLVGWLCFGIARRGGPLLGFALVLLASELVEPLNAAITGLAFLSLGAATLRMVGERDGPQDAAGLPAWLAVVMPVMALLAAVPTVSLLIGDVLLENAAYQAHVGNLPGSVATAKTGDGFQFHIWPDAASQIANVYFYATEHGEPTIAPLAVQWAQAAADRDPGNGLNRLIAAQYLQAAADPHGAYQDALQAYQLIPYDVDVLNVLGSTAAQTGHRGEAISWFKKSLAVNPDQAKIERYVHQLEQGCKVVAPTVRHSPLELSCS